MYSVEYLYSIEISIDFIDADVGEISMEYRYCIE